MVDEREDRYEGEEGEYHFSDDQFNYEEVDAPKSSQAAVSVKKSIVEKLANLSSSRRMLLVAMVFMSLIGVVYKMLLPSSAPVPADISKVTPEKKSVTPQPPVMAKAPAVSQAPLLSTQAPVAAQPQPTPTVVSPIPSSPPTQPSALQQPAGLNPALPPSQATMPASTYPATQQQAPTAMTAAPAPIMGATTPVPLPPNVADRVKAVEDHNAAIMNLLQTEYAQKISEFEMQSNLMRGKMDELSKRINRIESSLNQITQLLQQNAPPAANKTVATFMEGAPGNRPTAPRVTYTVQAIIPGRAWLKADSGDTITVAEGDTLRDYGRISKIDPYDGVVEIDTGNKIIALSYGMNAE